MYECSLQTKPMGPPHARSLFFYWGKHARSTIFVSERSVHATVAAVLELVYC